MSNSIHIGTPTESGTPATNALVLQVAADGNPPPLPLPLETALPVPAPTVARHGLKKLKHKKSRKLRAGPFSYEEMEELESENMPAAKAGSSGLVWGMVKAVLGATVGPIFDLMRGRK